LHFEFDFISYVKANQYPFKEELYKIRTGATADIHNINKSAEFIPMSNCESFTHFLKWIKQEYGINLLSNDHSLSVVQPELTRSLNDTIRDSSGKRMHTVLSGYQSAYKAIQNA
jgi:hypothetical protein